MKGPPKGKDKSRATGESGAPPPKGAFEPIAVLLRDEHGQLVLTQATFSPLKQGGAPKKCLRDVSLTLHYEFLLLLDKFKKTHAQDEVAKMFLLQESNRHATRRIINRTCTNTLVDYPEHLVIPGIDLDGNPTRILLALAAGSVQMGDDPPRVEGKGFAVKWGDKTAAYRNVKLSIKRRTPAP